MQWNAINAKTASFLLSSRATELLASLSPTDLRSDQLLKTLSRLRAHATADEAGAVLALAQQRIRAAEKFPQADKLYFVPEALEQATTWSTALRRAAWMDRHLPPGPLLDLGCGIGGDLLALAQFRQVYAYEIDPVRAQFAQANAVTMGLAQQVDIRGEDWIIAMEQGRLPKVAGAFADPARRRDGKRIFSLHEMNPPLGQLLSLQQQIPSLGIKVMPGVKNSEIPAACGVEFTGHDGACKEAILWFGTLAKQRRWASIEIEGAWHKIIAEDRTPPPISAVTAGNFIHEPHPAVIRAGAISELCKLLNAHMIAPKIAYLASATESTHALVQSFRVLEVHPFSLKQLNRRIRALGIGNLELKKRGFPVEPEQLRARLKLEKNGRSAVLLILRRDAGHEMILAERVTGL